MDDRTFNNFYKEAKMRFFRFCQKELLLEIVLGILLQNHTKQIIVTLLFSLRFNQLISVKGQCIQRDCIGDSIATL
jgi:hypothetical protein